jgi:hypothetical protein
LAAIVVAAPAPGLADWQVHRTDSSALLERAERALLESPDNDQLARRVIQIAGGKGRAGVRERFKGRAQRALQAGGPGAYAPLAAYARLLLATGDGKAAAAAFSDVLRVAPQSPAALAGRAQALAVAGDEAAALAASPPSPTTARRWRRRWLFAVSWPGSIPTRTTPPRASPTPSSTQDARPKAPMCLRRASSQRDSP